MISSDPKIIADAQRVILPGVGSFGDCMHTLENRGLVPVIQEALHSGKPFLGILPWAKQLLFEGSEEAPASRAWAFSRAR